jgi:hypothetical protein
MAIQGAQDGTDFNTYTDDMFIITALTRTTRGM